MRALLQLNRAAGVGLVGIAALLVPLLAACSSSTPTPTAAQPPTPTVMAAPAPTSTPTPIGTQPPTSTSTAGPTPTATPTPRPTATPSPTPTPTPSSTATPAFDSEREIGTYQGVTFLVGEGSEATFTVNEKLVRLPLPSDAVVRTMALSGEVNLDGRPSVIEIDLHQLRSDQALRDRWIRDRMFPNDPIAVFTLSDLSTLPDEFIRGEVATGEITGRLEIRGNEVSLNFEIEARDDGDVVFIIGRTTFTWEEFQIPVPNLRNVVQVEDEVRVEVLLAVRPLKGS